MIGSSWPYKNNDAYTPNPVLSNWWIPFIFYGGQKIRQCGASWIWHGELTYQPPFVNLHHHDYLKFMQMRSVQPNTAGSQKTYKTVKLGSAGHILEKLSTAVIPFLHVTSCDNGMYRLSLVFTCLASCLSTSSGALRVSCRIFNWLYLSLMLRPPTST